MSKNSNVDVVILLEQLTVVQGLGMKPWIEAKRDAGMARAHLPHCLAASLVLKLPGGSA